MKELCFAVESGPVRCGAALKKGTRAGSHIKTKHAAAAGAHTETH